MKRRYLLVALLASAITACSFPSIDSKGDEIDPNAGIEYINEDGEYTEDDYEEYEEVSSGNSEEIDDTEDVEDDGITEILPEPTTEEPEDVIEEDPEISEVEIPEIKDNNNFNEDAENKSKEERNINDPTINITNTEEDVYSASPSRYFVEAANEQMAKEIADAANAKLESYSEGIAVLTVKIPLKNTLNSMITKESPYESEMDVVVLGSDSKISKNDYDVTLYQDGYYEPADDIQPPELNEFYGYSRYELESIRWQNTYDNNVTGQGTVVAVLDSGCDIYHEDLNDNIIGTYNADNGSTDVTDSDMHGTHICGIIAAEDNEIGICGIAPDTKLYVVKIASKEGIFWYSNIIRGLNKCAELGYINVINMSFGGYLYSEGIYNALVKCANKGITLVSAAGNESTDKPCYPAAYHLGIGVAAHAPYANSTLVNFSNYGSENCDIVAPGSSIYSTIPGGGYDYCGGTSMAAPYVSAAAALLYSQENIPDNAMGAAYVKNRIVNSNNGITYTSNGHSAYGGLDIQNLFNLPTVSKPKNAKITVKEQKSTKQQLVTLSTKGEGDIYYTIDGTRPTLYNGTKYTKKIHIDKKGLTRLKAVVINKRRYSDAINTKKITVEKGVITQSKLKSVEIYINEKGTTKIKRGTVVQLNIKNNGKDLAEEKFTWTSSDSKIATIDTYGRIKVSMDAKKGKKVIIYAKLGSVKKSIELTVK